MVLARSFAYAELNARSGAVRPAHRGRGGVFPLEPFEGQNSSRGEAWNGKGIAATDLRKVELLTLSYSEAAIPKAQFSSEREFLGILRPLFFAGVKQVLAPRWQVQGDAAQELLQSFHQAYAKHHKAALALQIAQASLRRGEKFAHPHYWSGFILTSGVQR